MHTMMQYKYICSQVGLVVGLIALIRTVNYNIYLLIKTLKRVYKSIYTFIVFLYSLVTTVYIYSLVTTVYSTFRATLYLDCTRVDSELKSRPGHEGIHNNKLVDDGGETRGIKMHKIIKLQMHSKHFFFIRIITNKRIK